jgi:hypothetical protein
LVLQDLDVGFPGYWFQDVQRIMEKGKLMDTGFYLVLFVGIGDKVFRNWIVITVKVINQLHNKCNDDNNSFL